jgi:hypothetical protein
MCGGGGGAAFVPKYMRGFSGQSGGTVIPARTYTQTIGMIPNPDFPTLETPDFSTYAAFDGAISSTATGTYRALCSPPSNTGQAGPNMAYSASGGGWGATGSSGSLADNKAYFLQSGWTTTEVNNLNTTASFTVYNTTAVNSTDASQGFNGATPQSTVCSLYMQRLHGGLGGSAILTNGNSVTLSGNTGNIYGAIS